MALAGMSAAYIMGSGRWKNIESVSEPLRGSAIRRQSRRISSNGPDRVREGHKMERLGGNTHSIGKGKTVAQAPPKGRHGDTVR